jgi:hypothetical protein
MQTTPQPLQPRRGSNRRLLLALAQAGVILLGVAVLAAAALVMLLAQLSYNRDEAMIWTVGAAVTGVAALAGLTWLFIYLNRKRRNAGSAEPKSATAQEMLADADFPALQSTVQLLRIALIAILVLGLGGLVLRFMGGPPPVRLLVVSLVMFGLYVAPYAYSLLRIAGRYEEWGVALAHGFAWASLLMGLRLFVTFMRYTAEFRQVLVVSVLNLVLDVLVIYCGIRLWRAVRGEIFVALLVGALIYRVILDLLTPILYSRMAF